MNKIAAYRIYNASAGSGKTFTLVKEYLRRILQSENESHYQHLLAITFTNKAVAEMKQRILDALVSFSNPKSITEPPEMLVQLVEELDFTLEEIQLRSKRILKHLLHHYAGFSVETIDRFNHRIIRTFARDLKLAANFEVILDTPLVLVKAVDQLLNKAGEDQNITKILLDFAMEKTDDDKSWDISKDIAETASLLFSENYAIQVAKLKAKTLDDFGRFKKQLLDRRMGLSEKINKIAAKTLQLIDESGLRPDDFNSGYLPKHFQNLVSGRFTINLNARWQETMGDKPLYPKRVDANISSIIDELTPVFIANFETSKNLVHQFLLTDAILKNLTPLFVINLVNQEIESIKMEENILLISEFNALINSEIKDQPAPFVYERLGEKYRHFFIDEFQDTSRLQWENLIPLIDNALSQQDGNENSGTLLLVGDAKQSIYRWRGGLPEQFIGLYNEKNPFLSSEKVVLALDTNYRSCKEIVDFNNQLFSFVANYFGDNMHKYLYTTGSQQHTTNKKGGYIKFEFVEKQPKAIKDEVYAQRIYETILNLKKSEFNESEICVLTRNKKDGIFIGNYLMENGISVISSETLLLHTSSLVQCIIYTLKISIYPENEEVKMMLLDFLHNHLSISESKHVFFNEFLNTTILNFDEQLKKYDIKFSLRTLQSFSLYESCEYIIRQFRLQDNANAYLFSFMDLVFEFEQQPQANKTTFLEAWETQKNKASISSNEGIQAVQLMTIHKAKGLEFPVVLFPFADIQIYEARKDKIWYPLGDDQGYDFDEAPINYKKELANYSEVGSILYEEHRNKLELDNLNLLYVTLTRVVEQLYVYAEIPSEVKNDHPTSYNQLFGEFLKHLGKWNPPQNIYEFGNPLRTSSFNLSPEVKTSIPTFISSSPTEHNLKIVAPEVARWNTETQDAIFRGNLLHDIMAEINFEEDVTPFFDSYKERTIISSEDLELLKTQVLSIVRHPKLKHLFEVSAKVKKEKEIITASGMLLRPDRLNFHNDDSVTITDYKTGAPNYHHEDQITSYATALEDMGNSVSEKILVYTNPPEIVINKL